MEDISKYEEIVSSEYGRDMKEAAWDNLVSRYPEVSGLAVGDINGIRKLYPTVLRSSYKTLSVSQVQSMPNVSIREKYNWGFKGHSTINHDYNLKTIKGDKVVVDNATGLMWHQNGSNKYVKWNKAKEWVRSLNSRGYAGYQDWRLPTVDEAASLLESSEKNGDLYIDEEGSLDLLTIIVRNHYARKKNKLFIDPVFSKKQEKIWTGDRYDSRAAWYVNFGSGRVSWQHHISIYSLVRPVRSVE